MAGISMVEFPESSWSTTHIRRSLARLSYSRQNTLGRCSSKVTAAWLKVLGFTSSNDGTLIGVIKFIGFTDQSGIPTATWSAYRGAKHKAVLGEAIRRGYAELYAVYPDAHLRTNAELTHVFSTSSTAGSQVVGKTVATFKALVEEAEFPVSSEPEQTTLQTGPLHTPAAALAPNTPTMPQNSNDTGPGLHIDIQIHISPESTPDQIDKIFESMAKHLYGRRDG